MIISVLSFIILGFRFSIPFAQLSKDVKKVGTISFTTYKQLEAINCREMCNFLRTLLWEYLMKYYMYLTFQSTIYQLVIGNCMRLMAHANISPLQYMHANIWEYVSAHNPVIFGKF